MSGVKTTKRQYQKDVAEAYRQWLAENPKASKRRRVLAFDQIADKLRKQ